MMISVLFGAGTYNVDASAFKGPDLIYNDQRKKKVEKAFEKQRATLDKLNDSFKLEYGKHQTKTPSSVDEFMPDFVKINFTLPDGKTALEEVTRGAFHFSYGSLVRKAVTRALELSNYFHPLLPKKAESKEK